MTQLDKRKTNLIIALATWAFCMVSLKALGFLIFLPFVRENAAVLTAVCLLYPPVIVSIFQKKRLSYWNLNKKIILNDLKVFFIVSFVIFPAVFLGNHFYQSIFWNAPFHAGTSGSWLYYIVVQLVLIAFPEEFFFRGFLQEAFMGYFKTKKKVFGAEVNIGFFLTAAVFALSHSLLTLQWWHGFIFFPALIFGWLKQKTKTIWAGTLFHAACNLFAYWVALHY